MMDHFPCNQLNDPLKSLQIKSHVVLFAVGHIAFIRAISHFHGKCLKESKVLISHLIFGLLTGGAFFISIKAYSLMRAKF